MEIIWLPKAKQDLLLIKDYMSKDSAGIANQVISRIVLSIKSLMNNPRLGKPGRIKGTRELFLDDLPYTIPYQVQDSKIQILRVFHQSRCWP